MTDRMQSVGRVRGPRSSHLSSQEHVVPANLQRSIYTWTSLLNCCTHIVHRYTDRSETTHQTSSDLSASMSPPADHESRVESPSLLPTVIDDDDLAAQVDQALSSRRQIHHSRHRSSISLSLFRQSHLRKTDSKTSSQLAPARSNRSGDDVDQGDSDAEEEDDEANPEDKQRRRLRRSKRADPSVPAPIRLLVRKAELAKPVNVAPSGLPPPRAQHVHFPSSDDRPEGSASKRPSASSPDGMPELRSSIDAKSASHATNLDSSGSGALVNLLATRPEERHQAKAEVRKLKKGHAREYVWDGESCCYNLTRTSLNRRHFPRIVMFENQRGCVLRLDLCSRRRGLTSPGLSTTGSCLWVPRTSQSRPSSLSIQTPIPSLFTRSSPFEPFRRPIRALLPIPHPTTHLNPDPSLSIVASATTGKPTIITVIIHTTSPLPPPSSSIRFGDTSTRGNR